MAPAAARVVLITGASSGIGQACSMHLAALGYRVYGTSRHAPPFAPPSGNRPALIPIDVADEPSIAAALQAILSHEGRLDAVINNAGFGIAGPVEYTSIEDARRQFDINFFGVLRVCRATLPILRQQRSGTIINIGSIGGLIAIPFQSMYSASKFALEGFTESLRYEVAPCGIRVVLVEPGDHRTAFTANRQKTPLSPEGDADPGPYTAACQRALARMESDEQHGPPADNVARLVARILGTPKPRLRYTVGLSSQRSAVWLRRMLPFRFLESGMRRYYGLDKPPGD